MLASKHMEQPNKLMLLLISLPAGQYNEPPNKLFASSILRLMFEKISLRMVIQELKNGLPDFSEEMRFILAMP